jgi:hypothetical protein
MYFWQMYCIFANITQGYKRFYKRRTLALGVFVCVLYKLTFTQANFIMEYLKIMIRSSYRKFLDPTQSYRHRRY